MRVWLCDFYLWGSGIIYNGVSESQSRVQLIPWRKWIGYPKDGSWNLGWVDQLKLKRLRETRDVGGRR